MALAVILPLLSVVTVVAPLPLILCADVTAPFSTLFKYTLPLVNSDVVLDVELDEPTTFLLA